MPIYTGMNINLGASVWPRRIEHRPSRSAPTAEGGAYRAKRRHRRGVPRADVRAERRRPGERLRAEPHTVHANKSARKLGTDTRARVRVRVHRNTHALGNTHLYTPTRNTWTHVYVCVPETYTTIK